MYLTERKLLSNAYYKSAVHIKE